MDLSLSAEQEQLLDVVQALLDKHCTAEDVRRAEPLGYDDSLWARVHELGLTGPGAAGDHAVGLFDLALVGDACGRSLAPAPFVEAAVAARALARGGAAADAGTLVTFAPRPAADGRAALVPFGAVAERVVALDGDRLVVATQRPPGDAPRNLGSGGLASVPVRSDAGALDVEVLATGAEAAARHRVACDEWRVLMAAALAGLARGALDLGVAYVKERQQFGRPIGAFQAVAHRLAEEATNVDGATLLWQEAAWAADEGEPSAPALARMAFAFSSEVAESAATTSLHFHGGYGFMLEYDIQLFVRRAKAWPLAIGSRADAVAELADALYGPRRG